MSKNIGKIIVSVLFAIFVFGILLFLNNGLKNKRNLDKSLPREQVVKTIEVPTPERSLEDELLRTN